MGDGIETNIYFDNIVPKDSRFRYLTNGWSADLILSNLGSELKAIFYPTGITLIVDCEDIKINNENPDPELSYFRPPVGTFTDISPGFKVDPIMSEDITWKMLRDGTVNCVHKIENPLESFSFCKNLRILDHRETLEIFQDNFIRDGHLEINGKDHFPATLHRVNNSQIKVEIFEKYFYIRAREWHDLNCRWYPIRNWHDSTREFFPARKFLRKVIKRIHPED